MRMRENMEGLCEGGRGKNLIFQGAMSDGIMAQLRLDSAEWWATADASVIGYRTPITNHQ